MAVVDRLNIYIKTAFRISEKWGCYRRCCCGKVALVGIRKKKKNKKKNVAVAIALLGKESI